MFAFSEYLTDEYDFAPKIILINRLGWSFSLALLQSERRRFAAPVRATSDIQIPQQNISLKKVVTNRFILKKFLYLCIVFQLTLHHISDASIYLT